MADEWRGGGSTLQCEKLSSSYAVRTCKASPVAYIYKLLYVYISLYMYVYICENRVLRVSWREGGALLAGRQMNWCFA